MLTYKEYLDEHFYDLVAEYTNDPVEECYLINHFDDPFPAQCVKELKEWIKEHYHNFCDTVQSDKDAYLLANLTY